MTLTSKSLLFETGATYVKNVTINRIKLKKVPFLESINYRNEFRQSI